jgi:glycosyltransferase involved in cell wall biosynthesis
MACGTPVFTSNTSSMPEIGGKDAILVNPEQPDEIADMLIRLETDEAFYKEKRAVGLQRAQLFSWKRTAEQLLALYQEVGL